MKTGDRSHPASYLFNNIRHFHFSAFSNPAKPARNERHLAANCSDLAKILIEWYWRPKSGLCTACAMHARGRTVTVNTAVAKEGRKMGFLIRVTFWLGLVLVMIPYGEGSANDGDTVGPMQVLHAAGEFTRDLSGLCERKPDTCRTGGAILRTIGIRAREGARLAYEALDRKLADPDDGMTTGSVSKPAE